MLVRWSNHLLGLLQWAREEYGPTATLGMTGVFGVPTLFYVGSHPENIKHIYNNPYKFVRGEYNRTKFYEIFGDGIFFQDGDIWMHQRKTAMKLFTKANYIEFMKVFRKKNAQVVAIVEANLGRPLDVESIYYQYTMDAFGEIGFGQEFDNIGKTPAKFDFAYNFDKVLSHLPRIFIYPLWVKALWLRFTAEGREYNKCIQLIDEYIYKIVDSLLANQDQMATRNDMVSLFFKYSPEKPSRKYLRDIVLNLIIAGRDTTAQTLTWFTHEMTLNPAIQQDIYDEMKDYYVAGNVPDYDTISDPVKTKRLSGFLTESLRLNATIPKTFRLAEEKSLLPDGTVIAKGCPIAISPYIMGRCPLLWENPTELIPERHYTSKEGQEQFEYPDMYTFTTFNAGKRECIGKHFAYTEIKQLVGLLTNKYTIEIVKDQNVELKESVGLPTKHGLKVVFNPRK